jgi:Domain of unknown function (DUF6457)
MNAREWTDAYAKALGVEPPTKEEFERILELAAEAAHSSERVAAPVACWIAAAAGHGPDEALEAARQLASAET